MRLAILAASALLAGCAGTVQLIGDGKSYQGTLNTGSKSMEVVMDGEVYRGGWVMGGATASTDSLVGVGRPYPILATGTTTIQSNEGRILLVSPSNKVIRCTMLAQGRNAQGECVDSLGRRFDLIAKVQ